MEIALLGSSGIRVSRVGLGCGFRNQTDPRVMESAIRRAVERGVTLLDCSNFYGKTSDTPYGGTSELALGRAIAGCRDDVVITSKVGCPIGPGPNDLGGSRMHIVREIDRSLRRLQTDHVDIYIVHWRDPDTALEETVSAMLDVIRQGKARAWGMSGFSAWESCKALMIAERLGGPRPAMIMHPYNLLDRTPELELLPFCRAEQVGFFAFSPLAVGLLTGFYRPNRPPPPGSVMAAPRRRAEFDQTFRGRAFQVLAAVERIAAARACAPAHVALNWVRSNPDVSVTLMGVDTPDQVDANLNAVSWSLSADELSELHQVSRSPASLA
ncbi:MAG: aldo/keto reductase [Chloroflexota bacterium]|nr:aldo/keto reductase [Chloroflexota bacterium]